MIIINAIDLVDYIIYFSEKININEDIKKVIEDVLIKFKHKKTYELVDEIIIDSFFVNQ